jgi:mycofactocin glycosyltransferase
MGDGLNDLTVALAGDVRVLDGGRLLVGGSPMRALRVSEAGRTVIREWCDGGTVGTGSARVALARRLLDHDMLAPRPAPAASTAEVTVVIPARDRLPALERCLHSVRASVPDSAVIVVDDGSADRAAVRAAAERAGAYVIRHERSAGPAAARNSGLRACTTAFVAFVDSDVVVAPGWAEPLLGHFVDARLGAVAPRVVALVQWTGAIGRYEQRHSPLDMGAGGGQVGPGRRVPYVPAVVLVVRRSAAGEGFDGSLEVGEDVDFVWRLTEAGWGVRYDAGVEICHEHRDTLRSFARRRREYAASVAMLAARHPGALPAVRLSRTTALAWLLLLLGHPTLAAAAVGWDIRRAARALEHVSERPWRLAAGLVVRGLLGAGEGLARATRRVWLGPLLAVAVWRPRTIGLVYAAFLEALVRDLREAHDPRKLASDAAVRVVDELAALAGTWEGCLRERSLEPLLPRLEHAGPR